MMGETMLAAKPQLRGDALLLEHCAALARLDRPHCGSFSRLVPIVGFELARLLVRGLTAGPGRCAA
jgi:hypothetical protein